MPPATDTEALSHAELRAWRGFLRAHAALTRELDAALSDTHDLPLTSYEVLLRLHEAPRGRLRMSEVAGSLLLSRSGVTRLVDRLERGGMLERRECEDDGRGYWAVITPAGRRAFEAAQTTHLTGVRERFLRHFSPAELEQLAHLWARVAPA